jgi:hypothetical protein
MEDYGLPDGAVAYREYEVPLAEGGNASMGFTLARRDADSIASDLARALHARAYGFVSILDYPAAPRHPVVWLQLPTQLALTVADGDEDLSEDLKQIIARYLIQFIRDIAPIAPELAALHFENPGSSDRSLN